MIKDASDIKDLMAIFMADKVQPETEIEEVKMVFEESLTRYMWLKLTMNGVKVNEEIRNDFKETLCLFDDFVNSEDKEKVFGQVTQVILEKIAITQGILVEWESLADESTEHAIGGHMVGGCLVKVETHKGLKPVFITEKLFDFYKEKVEFKKPKIKSLDK